MFVFSICHLYVAYELSKHSYKHKPARLIKLICFITVIQDYNVSLFNLVEMFRSDCGLNDGDFNIKAISLEGNNLNKPSIIIHA